MNPATTVTNDNPASPDTRLFAAGFANLESEVSVDGLPVRGRLPEWLSGSLLRVAPCRYDLGKQTVHHWFDGLAMLHKFSFAAGRVAYANRFLHSEEFERVQSTGRLVAGEFATDPCVSLFLRVMAKFFPKLTDNANVNVSSFANEMVALTETRMPVRFDAETLETLGHFEINPELKGIVSIAHPHYDRERKCAFSFLLDFGLKCRYRLFAIDDDGTQRPVAEMPIDRPAYMHSFGMSRQYLVLAEFPLVVNPLSFVFRFRPFIRHYRWRPERGLRFHVFDKDDGRRVRTVETDAVFSFHHINAFEHEGEVVVDLVAHRDSTIIDQLYLARLRAGEPVAPVGPPLRYRIPLSPSAPLRTETLSDVRLELPRVDYSRVGGENYRTLWGAGNHQPGNFLDSIVKIDVSTGQSLTWHEAGAYPGEPVFVRRPDASDADTGVLLSVVLDAPRRCSYLLVLDAQSLQELARAECPHHIPFGFHGNYFPARAT